MGQLLNMGCVFHIVWFASVHNYKYDGDAYQKSSLSNSLEDFNWEATKKDM